jgi:hypothetical protein
VTAPVFTIARPAAPMTGSACATVFSDTTAP